jgi:AraC-like DNA-binding protein
MPVGKLMVPTTQPLLGAALPTVPAELSSPHALLHAVRPGLAIEPALRMVLCTTAAKSPWARASRAGFDELAVFVGGESEAMLGDRRVQLRDGSLVFCRAGELRGCAGNIPEFMFLWSVCFQAERDFVASLSNLALADPTRRVWSLLPEQISEFKSVFVKIAAEAATHQSGDGIAESAWLRLLLVMAQRWSESRGPAHISAKPLDSEVVRLWKRITELVHTAGSHSEQQLRAHLPNYDSLRHRFQKTFGLSPQRMLMSMRMEAAKNLLLSSSLSVKEIAEKLGYARQHEFCRAFKRVVGRSPTAWKAEPLA